MNQQAIDQVITTVKFLLEENKIKEALTILKKEVAPISNDLESSIILQQGRHAGLNQKKIEGTINSEDFDRDKRVLSRNMIALMDTIKTEIEVKRIMGQYVSIYTTTSQDNLEKIQGSENNLVPMSWIYKSMEVSKSVCQVVRADGTKGTGWMLDGGWMMTNFHVIPNAEKAGTSKIVFNYEEDLHGSNAQTCEYKLSSEGALFSSLLKLDYAYIKVIDAGDVPLSNWGYLEVDSFSEPQIDQRVAIIQHPKGEKKQIALTGNKITAKDSHKLFYMTDTERGSSGAPVLDKDWKVIALHHAGKTEEDGGLVINAETGERQGANEGILIKDIMEDIKSKLEQ